MKSGVLDVIREESGVRVERAFSRRGSVEFFSVAFVSGFELFFGVRVFEFEGFAAS